MSHYTVTRTKICNEECLIKALQNMGFKSHMIEVSKTPLSLKGYTGDTREQTANVRIRGAGWGSSENYVGSASNDLGWELQSDGTYIMHVSEYDRGKYNESWQNKLMQQYSKEVIKDISAKNSLFIEEEIEENGEIFIQLSSPF